MSSYWEKQAGGKLETSLGVGSNVNQDAVIKATRPLVTAVSGYWVL